MNPSEQIAAQLEKTLTGESWYGPPWREVLAGTSLRAAHHRPIPEAHTIAEIVHHTITWQNVVRLRLEGETPEVTDAEDWPRAGAGEKEWAAARERLLESGRALCETVRRFPPERLHETRPGLDSSWYNLILGELQHVVYHAGQVGILRKAAPAEE